jgi:hypothetical protein
VGRPRLSGHGGWSTSIVFRASDEPSVTAGSELVIEGGMSATCDGAARARIADQPPGLSFMM